MPKTFFLPILILLLNGNVKSLPSDDPAQVILQHNVDELKQTVVGLTQEVEELKHPKVIAFLAELGGNYFVPTYGQTLIYNQVHLNTGNGYSEYQGIFTAPVSGIYYINVAVTASESTSNGMRIKIKRNADEVGFLSFESPMSRWVKRSDAIIIHLNTNDKVMSQVTYLKGRPQIATIFAFVNSLLLDNNAQSTLQRDVDELKQTVTALKQEVEKLKHPTVVAFLAELGGSYFTPTVGQHLIYSNVHFNTGNGYHKFHGTFIAPMQIWKVMLLYCTMLINVINGTKVKWEISEVPVIFGRDVKLTCKISDTKNCCHSKSKTRIWFGGPDNKTLSLDGKSPNRSKYVTLNEEHGFSLIIKSLSPDDVNYYYRCSYGFHEYRKKLQINSDFENLPMNSTTKVTYSFNNDVLHVNLQLQHVHPIPNCTVFYREKDLSSIITVNITKDKLFYNTEFNLNYSVRATKCGTLKVTCTVGTSPYELINKNIHDKHNDFDDGCLQTTHDSWNQLMVIIPSSIVICIVVILVYTKWRNRIRGHYQLSTVLNDQGDQVVLVGLSDFV
ncbi:C1QL [Mytilus coruscus]|uniref:C1QL n=1 Tax=Mytilus coruscus TaxID=42192 RepID=A0A6J8B3G8_MYTCO|nr:C1QL [Mytilus coruscus]